ncbi:hypothetical protein AB6A40_003488 [Gnathostoma spinigerum]|uniref:Protein SHQ1 homolog n=1 Tax=Gnathostoma spinigerum TaxID=75299 RepID=A0ABD6EF89_9BILA
MPKMETSDGDQMSGCQMSGCQTSGCQGSVPLYMCIHILTCNFEGDCSISMITPVFAITQDENYLFITIRAPYANVKDTEIDYDEKMFYFSSTPYYLRLHLSHNVINDESGSAKYDSEKGTFLVKVPKKTKGEQFVNLDMINELLKPTSVSASKLVEEVDGENRDDLIVQKEPEEEERVMDELCVKFGYGFGWRRHGVLGRLIDEIGHLIDLEEPETSVIDDRLALCVEYDQLSFQADHYLADLFETEEGLENCLHYQLPSSSFALSSADREQLKNIPSRKLPGLTESEDRDVALSLVDILFAYLYDVRTTFGEHSVESGWTISKLSPSLSFLLRWNSPFEALCGAIRRSLCYPLYRHWELSQMVVQDLTQVLRRGEWHCIV